MNFVLMLNTQIENTDVFAIMREYCVELRHSNYQVIYKSLEDDCFREKYENKLISVIKTQRIKKFF